MRAYAEAFDAGHAHSFEVWNEKGELSPAATASAIGGAFVDRIAVLARANTSKIGFTVLNWHLAHWGYRLQRRQADEADLSKSVGFREDPRSRISGAAWRRGAPRKPGGWQMEAGLGAISQWQPTAPSVLMCSPRR